jgi:DNA polymerase
VPGEGNPNAKIVFLGESPGAMENKIGKPFVGMSGKFLNSLFDRIKLSRKSFFITSVIKCHPSKNRNPRTDEILACQNWWQAQIKIIKPAAVVLLGRIALKAVLECDDLSNCHGKKIIKSGAIYFPTFHPAAGRRFPSVKRKMIKDFRSIKRLIS